MTVNVLLGSLDFFKLFSFKTVLVMYFYLFIVVLIYLLVFLMLFTHLPDQTNFYCNSTIYKTQTKANNM